VDVRFRIGDLEFTWDLEKYRRNILKHAITFEEAATSWLDPDSLERFDEKHAASEDRWLRLGLSLRGALLVTWSTERVSQGKSVIRIIGARRATRNERRLYEEKKSKG
jgi:uncharacterized DUF497 family protein